MSPVLESIARENLRSSGYLSRPDDRRRPTLGFARRTIPFATTDIVHDALQRRERARFRDTRKPHPIKQWLHGLFHR